MQKNITVLLLLFSSMGIAQIRPFDNSKAVLPWLYNPAVNFTKDFQVYVGYDGRGNNSFMPQSMVAGLRMPVVHKGGSRNPHTMIGVQVLNTKQDLLKQSTINATFAHQIDINKTTRLALGMGAGIFNMNYSPGDLVYVDMQDPLLNNVGSFYNIHLNAGASLILGDKFSVNIAAPYLVKDSRANFKEVILRTSYKFAVNQDVNVIPSFNLDTYNKNMIYGGDLRVEWRKLISVLAGVDRFKYHGGILFDVKPICFGYTYGQNFDAQLGNIASHQISVYGHIVAKHNNF